MFLGVCVCVHYLETFPAHTLLPPTLTSLPHNKHHPIEFSASIACRPFYDQQMQVQQKLKEELERAGLLITSESKEGRVAS
jgi:hypothetical protein